MVFTSPVPLWASVHENNFREVWHFNTFFQKHYFWFKWCLSCCNVANTLLGMLGQGVLFTESHAVKDHFSFIKRTKNHFIKSLFKELPYIWQSGKFFEYTLISPQCVTVVMNECKYCNGLTCFTQIDILYKSTYLIKSMCCWKHTVVDFSLSLSLNKNYQ